MRLRRSIIGATPLFVAVFLLTASCAKVQPHFTVPKMTVSDPSFIPTMEAYTASTVSRGNRVDFLLNGQKIFPAQLAAIRSAQRTITYAQYFYEDGKPAVLLVEAISERCRAGVRGHVLLDAFGSLKMPPELRQQLQDAGCEVATFRPLRPWALDEANNRNHRRILVVDGKVGFTGGSGASSKWMGNGRREGHWRETDARMEGPAVNDLQGAFAENWLEATGHVLGGDGYFAPQPARGTVRAQVVRSSPTNGSFAVYTMYLLAMSSARRNIYMTNPYFLPDEQMRKALVEARRRGVRVVLLLPGAIDNNIVRQASRGGIRRAAGRGYRDPRVPLGTAPREDHGGGRPLGDGREHQCGQPVLRAERRAEPCPLRRGDGGGPREDLHRRPAALAAGGPGRLAGARSDDPDARADLHALQAPALRAARPC